jgi:hypothetical protein
MGSVGCGDGVGGILGAIGSRDEASLEGRKAGWARWGGWAMLFVSGGDRPALQDAAVPLQACGMGVRWKSGGNHGVGRAIMRGHLARRQGGRGGWAGSKGWARQRRRCAGRAVGVGRTLRRRRTGSAKEAGPHLRAGSGGGRYRGAIAGRGAVEVGGAGCSRVASGTLETAVPPCCGTAGKDGLTRAQARTDASTGARERRARGNWRVCW